MGGPPAPYSDWPAWAHAEFDNDPRRAELAVRAAVEAQSVGAGIDAAIRAARSAAGAPTPSWVLEDGWIDDAGEAAGTHEPQAYLATVSGPVDPFGGHAIEPVPISLAAPTIILGTPGGRSPASNLGFKVISRLLRDWPLALTIALLVLLLAGTSVGVAQQFLASPVKATEQASRPRYVVPSPALPTPSPLPSWTPAAKPPISDLRVRATCPLGYRNTLDGFACFRTDVPLPSPIAGATMRYYDVTGSTGADVVQQMRAKGPGCFGDEAQMVGCTASAVFVDVAFHPVATSSSNGSCVITSVQSTGHNEVLVPRWTPSAGTPPELERSWRLYLTGLYTHEAGHVQINTAGMQAIIRSLVGALCSQANQLIAQGYANISAQQHAYHVATNYGRTQVPAFP